MSHPKNPFTSVEVNPIYPDHFPDSGINTESKAGKREVLVGTRLTDILGPTTYGQKSGSRDGVTIRYVDKAGNIK